MNNQSSSSAISPDVIRFFFALAIISVVVEITDKFSPAGAWALFLILIFGVLLNNPLAIGLINLGGNALQGGGKTNGISK